MSSDRLRYREAEAASALVELATQSLPTGGHWLPLGVHAASKLESNSSTPEFAKNYVDLTEQEPEDMTYETSADEVSVNTPDVVEPRLTSSHLARERMVKSKTMGPGVRSKSAPKSNQQTHTQHRATPRLWLEYEKAATRTLMREVINEYPTDFTEWRFKEVSERLVKRFGIDRSRFQVKNFWNREGRLTSGLDERKKPRPERMATGVQDPARRRFLRSRTLEEIEDDSFRGGC
ncbi:hypothetical protein P7C71_g2630, partial [Lecanoromycetidae sp. Uapishka_2]